MRLQIPVRRLLVLAPHADDEVLGAGGLMARASDQGVEVTAVCAVTEGPERGREFERAAKILGPDIATRVIWRDHTRWLDEMRSADLVSAIEHIIQEIKPDMVVMPEQSAFHQEHRAVSLAAIAATRPSGGTRRHRPTLIAAYEQVTDAWPPNRGVPRPNLTVDLTEAELDRKCAAMSAHASQVRQVPSERSEEAIRALARLRGAQAGVEFAEVFATMREVW